MIADSRGPKPFERPRRPSGLSADLTVTSVGDVTEIQTPLASKKGSTGLLIGQNSRPPMQTNNSVKRSHSLTRKIMASPGTVNSSSVKMKQTPSASVKRANSHAPIRTSTTLKTTRTPTVSRSGSSAVNTTCSTRNRPPPVKSKVTTSVKKASANSSFGMNESVMSFVAGGVLAPDGHIMTKTEEEKTRIDIEVANCRIVQYQILRARLRKATETQSRGVIAQLGALWEETQRLKESAAQKQSEAADIRRQRELHSATKLGGGIINDVNENVVNLAASTPPQSLAKLKVPSSRKGGSSNRENESNSGTDLKAISELLGLFFSILFSLIYLFFIFSTIYEGIIFASKWY